MPNLEQILVKATPLLKKIEKVLFEHDSRLFKNSPFALTALNQVNNRKIDSSKIHQLFNDFIEILLTPKVLKSIAVHQPYQFSEDAPDVLYVIGKPRNFYVYANKDFGAVIIDYLGRVRMKAKDFLQDENLSVFKIMSTVFRSAEVYQIVDDAGKFEQLSKMEGLKCSGLTVDEMDNFLRTGSEI